MLLSYKEAQTGQILHMGINEAGSAATLATVGTSHAVHGEMMMPFYIFYSMFGFQRTGDQFWAAADQLARGFIIGATAGRTTLTGEGLQHIDGHSPVLASTNPADGAFTIRLTPTRSPTSFKMASSACTAMVGWPRSGRHVLHDRLQRADSPAC